MRAAREAVQCADGESSVCVAFVRSRFFVAAVAVVRMKMHVAFAVMFVLVRVIGKRELSALDPFDLVLLIVLGDALQQGLTQDDYSLTGAFLAIGTIAVLQVFMSYANWRFPKLRPWLDGLPIVMLQRVCSNDEAMALANASPLGLTAGFYGASDEIGWFQDHIEAGVTYANRPQGATTGAWPGYQAFGGWKGSGSTGKAIGSYYYLPQYLREQSQTIVE